MAESGNVPELGGYDNEFTSKVPEDWECLVCHLTMKDPVQIVGCGHRLCNICMESLFRRPSPTCPADRQPLARDKIFPDAACHRKILDLTVKCPHVRCSWTGELRAVEKHQSECPFKVLYCPNSGCTEKLIMRDLHGHVALECPWRKVNCEYCQELFIMNQIQEHLSEFCPKFPVHCTNKCGLRDIPREKLDVHIRDECPATEVQCEYKNLGCEGKFPRSNAKSHSKTEVERHLNLALRGLEATQLQVKELVSLGKDQSQQIERSVSKDTEQSQQIEGLMSKKSNKPSAHIEAASRRVVTYQANHVIKDWSTSAPYSHLAGEMDYNDGKLTVPASGRYYIYVQIFYQSSGRIHVLVNNRVITFIQPPSSGAGHGSLFAGGVFNLKAGDVISLKAYSTITVYMESVHTYFGAFMI